MKEIDNCVFNRAKLEEMWKEYNDNPNSEKSVAFLEKEYDACKAHPAYFIEAYYTIDGKPVTKEQATRIAEEIKQRRNETFRRRDNRKFYPTSRG